MKYCLNQKYALRSFWNIPYCYYERNEETAKGLTEDEFNLLLKCDGLQDIEESELLTSLIDRGMAIKANKGEVLNEWQKHKSYNNRYMPKMNLQITGRCNYNCKHCFNAKDNAPIQTELTKEQMYQLLDEAKACGINALTITGGEPLLYPHFIEMMRAIYERDMFVFEINTNGFYITQSILDELKKLDCYPLIKISYDGIGFHNWMRGSDKAEEATINAIKLCIANGFRVKVQMNINRKNIDCIMPTLDYMDSLGVYETRVIKTTDVPRWLENGKGLTFDLDEYMDVCLDITKKYIAKPHKMTLTMWVVATVRPKYKSYFFFPCEYNEKTYRETIPICKGVRGMIAVGSNGSVYPCFQVQGMFESRGYYYGNVFKDSLQKLLQESDYMKLICTSIKDRCEYNKKCGTCEFLKKCGGGCPAVAITSLGDYLYPDVSRCTFFEKGYEEKFKEVLQGYHNER